MAVEISGFRSRLPGSWQSAEAFRLCFPKRSGRLELFRALGFVVVKLGLAGRM
jgi:hypothetical protein